jgi:hypothetical protein
MRGYGFQAVHDSLRNLRRQQHTENPLALAGMKAILRVLSAVQSFKGGDVGFRSRAVDDPVSARRVSR